MNIQEQIENYISGQPEQKRDELLELHRLIVSFSPSAKLWFLDGKNEQGKVVSNPNIGYGQQTIRYANGKTRNFYQVGLSANATGVSIYLMGVEDKKYLSQTYGPTLGKASVTGYCVKLRTLRDVDIGVVEEVLRFGLGSPALDMN